MRCPGCHGVLAAEAEACPQCGLTIAALADRLGRPPALRPLLNDPAGALSSRETQRIERLLRDFRRQFPQLFLTVVLDRVPQATPIASHAFWLFNSGDFCRQSDRGGKNFNVLLIVDVEHRRANLMIGYGLEPLVSPDDLQTVAASAAGDLQAGRFGPAVTIAVQRLAAFLHRLGGAVPDTFGVHPDFVATA